LFSAGIKAPARHLQQFGSNLWRRSPKTRDSVAANAGRRGGSRSTRPCHRGTNRSGPCRSRLPEVGKPSVIDSRRPGRMGCPSHGIEAAG
jgi:hypothetical protein